MMTLTSCRSMGSSEAEARSMSCTYSIYSTTRWRKLSGSLKITGIVILDSSCSIINIKTFCPCEVRYHNFFSVLTLLVGQQEGHLAGKNLTPTITKGSLLEDLWGTRPNLEIGQFDNNGKLSSSICICQTHHTHSRLCSTRDRVQNMFSNN